jgi:hypothetical protein
VGVVGYGGTLQCLTRVTRGGGSELGRRDFSSGFFVLKWSSIRLDVDGS